MRRHFTFALTVAGAIATATLVIDLGACSTESGSPASPAPLSCELGGGCSPTQVCTGGIVGCESNCQCVRGTWEAPCPAEMPQGGTSCSAEGATCGYMTTALDCGGSVNCYCQGGAWACGPACVTPDAGPDGAGCIAAGGECLYPNVVCAVPGPQSCGAVVPGAPYCCLSNVADCGQPSATTYACPPAQPEGGLTCPSAPVPLGAPNYKTLMQATDNDASYPVGCRVTFPACNNGHVPYCTCQMDREEPIWSCFP